jgi:hypothetical protein
LTGEFLSRDFSAAEWLAFQKKCVAESKHRKNYRCRCSHPSPSSSPYLLPHHYPSGSPSISSDEVLPSVQASQPANEGNSFDDLSGTLSISSDEVISSVQASQPTYEDGETEESFLRRAEIFREGGGDSASE